MDDVSRNPGLAEMLPSVPVGVRRPLINSQMLRLFFEDFCDAVFIEQTDLQEHLYRMESSLSL